MLRIAMSSIMRCRSGVTCTLITELPSVGLHTGAILTYEGSNEMRASLLTVSHKGRETDISRRLGNGSVERFPTSGLVTRCDSLICPLLADADMRPDSAR